MAVTHSKAWFGKEHSEGSVRSMHIPIVRQTSAKHKPVVRLRVHAESVKLYKEPHRLEMSADELTRGVGVVPIVSASEAGLDLT